MSLHVEDTGAGEITVPSEAEVVMTPSQKRYYASETCLTARMELQELVDSPLYNTEASYYSGSELGFVDRHLYYLSTHPTTNLPGYISNLKLMTATRQRG